MGHMNFTNTQARNFLLLKHGLTGDYKYRQKEGVLDFIRQAGCIQFDPIDVCGRNADLVLQSRVRGYRKQMLYDLLYKDRALIDYFDKNLAIFPIEDWKYFERYREQHRNQERSHAEIKAVCSQIKDIIRKEGAVCSSDLKMPDKVDWYWNSTKLSRAALEHMYFTGELAVHHKKGTIKYYDLIENCVPDHILTAQDPYTDDFAHMKWRVLRRIRSVGLLWNRASDAWLNIGGLKARPRNEIFRQLISEGKIVEVRVEGISELLYFAAEDMPLAAYVLDSPGLKKRCELMAPLDNMLWDRKLIKAVFDFDYKWEIYTPQAERKYGYYVLPVLYGNCFAGRIETVCDRKKKRLTVNHIWYEKHVKPSRTMVKMLGNCIRRFGAFHDMEVSFNGIEQELLLR